MEKEEKKRDSVFPAAESDPVVQMENEIRNELVLQARKMFTKMSELLVPSNNNVARILRLMGMSAAHYKKMIGNISAPDSVPKRIGYRVLGGSDDDFDQDDQGFSVAAQPVQMSGTGGFLSTSSAETFGAQAIRQLAEIAKPFIESTFGGNKSEGTVTSLDISTLTNAVSTAKVSGLKDIEKDLQKTLRLALDEYNKCPARTDSSGPVAVPMVVVPPEEDVPGVPQEEEEVPA